MDDENTENEFSDNPKSENCDCHNCARIGHKNCGCCQ